MPTASNERTVGAIAGSNTQPVWTPDSAHLLFVSERSGRRDLFAVSAQGGGSATEPVLVQAAFTGHPLGVSRSGDLFYVGPYNGGFHQVIAERTSSGARIVQTFGGGGGMWSRGNKLAFIQTGEAGNDLIVLDHWTQGEERLYQHAGIGVVSPRWLRDGFEGLHHVFILILPPPRVGSISLSTSTPARSQGCLRRTPQIHMRRGRDGAVTGRQDNGPRPSGRIRIPSAVDRYCRPGSRDRRGTAGGDVAGIRSVLDQPTGTGHQSRWQYAGD